MMAFSGGRSKDRDDVEASGQQRLARFIRIADTVVAFA
jgi:hypothetical protein